ncbi:Nn.00g027520.m01.CDS01 [Neocucurbitaria sp. VM-36]
MAESPYGLKIVVNPESPDVDIVFVHGLTGGWWDTWAVKGSQIFWPGDLLPKDVPNARILSFGYDADIVRLLDTASSNTIRDHGNSLAMTLAMRRARSDSQNRPLIFVAHSLGGFVAEQSLLIARGSTEPHVSALLESVRGIIFLGTPHAGAQLAVWASLLTNMSRLFRQTNKEIVRVLEPGSEMLANLQQEFHTLLYKRFREESHYINIMCFYEELAVPGVGRVVPPQSAILSTYPNQSIYANHMDMTKFSRANDAGYEAISGKLWLWVREIGPSGGPDEL